MATLPVFNVCTPTDRQETWQTMNLFCQDKGNKGSVVAFIPLPAVEQKASGFGILFPSLPIPKEEVARLEANAESLEQKVTLLTAVAKQLEGKWKAAKETVRKQQETVNQQRSAVVDAAEREGVIQSLQNKALENSALSALNAQRYAVLEAKTEKQTSEFNELKEMFTTLGSQHVDLKLEHAKMSNTLIGLRDFYDTVAFGNLFGDFLAKNGLKKNGKTSIGSQFVALKKKNMVGATITSSLTEDQLLMLDGVLRLSRNEAAHEIRDRDFYVAALDDVRNEGLRSVLMVLINDYFPTE